MIASIVQPEKDTRAGNVPVLMLEKYLLAESGSDHREEHGMLRGLWHQTLDCVQDLGQAEQNCMDGGGEFIANSGVFRLCAPELLMTMAFQTYAAGSPPRRKQNRAGYLVVNRKSPPCETDDYGEQGMPLMLTQHLRKHG